MKTAEDILAGISQNPAERYRERAAYYERLARLAKRDGDQWHAAEADGKAAELRQKAREIEAREDTA